MSPDQDQTSLCERVLDRLVEGDQLSGDRNGERILAEHLRSCVTCFRALTELRDAPRMAEALRAEAPVLPHPSDRFWDDLAARTTLAAQAELQRAQGALPEGQTPETTAATSVGPSVPVRARRPSGARVRIISVAATLAAAAAGFLLVARGPLHSPSGIPATPATLVNALRSRTTASVDRSVATEAMADEEADVAELDVGALHRLLDRLRPSAPAALTAAGGGSADAVDVLGDDEARVNEELADLDGDELRRVASSLGAGTF
jgi:hypothetical protein